MNVFRPSTWSPRYRTAGSWIMSTLGAIFLLGLIAYGIWYAFIMPKKAEVEAASSDTRADLPPPPTPPAPPAVTVVNTNDSEITIVAPMTLVAEDPNSTEIFDYKPVMEAVKSAVAAATEKHVKVKVFAPITAISGTNSHVSLIFDSTGTVTSDTRYALPGPEFSTNRPSWYHSTISAKFGNALFP